MAPSELGSALVGKTWTVRPYVVPRDGPPAFEAPDATPGRFPLRASAARGSRSTVDFCRSFLPLLDPRVAPHTLILGTLPSVNSFDRCEYYATPSNAFWWIVGDALGHRRGAPPGGWADSQRRPTTVPRFITTQTLHTGPELRYDEAVQRLTGAGFALWDVLHEAEREGSTDPKIRSASERPNDVQAFARAHPSVTRICFSGGIGTATRFARANRQWLQTPGAFTLADTPATRKVFQKLVPPPPPAGALVGSAQPIVLCVMLSVSAAFAQPWRGSGERIYIDKRANWFEHCFCIPVPPERALDERANSSSFEAAGSGGSV